MLMYKTHTNETDVTMNNGTVCTVVSGYLQ